MITSKPVTTRWFLLTPNLLSFSRLLSAPLFALTFFTKSHWALPGCFLLVSLAQISDYLDGKIARSTGQVSDHGKLLDPLADFIFYLTLFACYTWQGIMPLWMYGLILGRELIMNLLLRPFLKKRCIILAARTSGKIKTGVQGVVASLVLILFFLETMQQVSASLVVQTGFWLFLLVTFCSLGSLTDYLWVSKKMLL